MLKLKRRRYAKITFDENLGHIGLIEESNLKKENLEMRKVKLLIKRNSPR